MDKESFVAALIMMEYKRLTPIDKFPTKLFKDGVDVHVYNRNVIVRLGTNTKNHHLDQDLEQFETFLASKTEQDYGWTTLGQGTQSNTFGQSGFNTPTIDLGCKVKSSRF